jgi:hypothetical protein
MIAIQLPSFNVSVFMKSALKEEGRGTTEREFAIKSVNGEM